VDYLQREKNTGRLSFRRAYPHELRSHIPGRPRGLKRPRGVTDIRAAGGLDRFQDAAEGYDATSAKARKVASGTFGALDVARIF